MDSHSAQLIGLPLSRVAAPTNPPGGNLGAALVSCPAHLQQLHCSSDSDANLPKQPQPCSMCLACGNKRCLLLNAPLCAVVSLTCAQCPIAGQAGQWHALVRRTSWRRHIKPIALSPYGMRGESARRKESRFLPCTLYCRQHSALANKFRPDLLPLSLTFVPQLRLLWKACCLP